MGAVLQFPVAHDGNEIIADPEDYLAGFIERHPFEDLDDEFQRGMLSGLMSAYEIMGFDQKDARYLAGRRLLTRMKVACDNATAKL